MKSSKVTFTGSHGEALVGRIDKPDEGISKGMVLFAHCFTCGKNLKSIGNISRTLTEHGIGVFRFDFTGIGESEGDFSDTDFSSNVKDLEAAALFMEREWSSPRMLIGHSLGGAAVLHAAHEISSVEAVITIAAPSNPKHVRKLILNRAEELDESDRLRVQLAGRTFTIKKEFLRDLNEQTMDKIIKNLEKALLIFHSPVDRVVNINNAAHIYTMAKHPKSFISLDDADHLLTKEKDAHYVGSVAAAWVDRYL